MKLLIKTFFIAALVSIATFAHAQKWGKGVKGSGNIATETRNVGEFDEIDLGGAWDVKLVKGTEGKVVITTDDNLLEIIKTEVKNGTLHVKNEENINKMTKAEMTIYYRDIEGLDISGACNITAKDEINSNRFSLDASGASKVMLGDLDVSTFIADFSGASSIELKGKTNELTIDVSGATSINAYDLQANTVVVDASGASSAKVSASSKLTVDASGASSIKYRGKPSVSKDVSGAASVKSSSL
ncbi:MAG: head GIN domain-containing protein [Bacteroidota bacterium]